MRAVEGSVTKGGRAAVRTKEVGDENGMKNNTETRAGIKGTGKIRDGFPTLMETRMKSGK